MDTRTTYELADGVATITMDDGKVNAMSTAMLQEIDAAFRRAEADRAAVLLIGRPGIFSAGFDLKIFMGGSAAEIHAQLRAGAELAHRILGFPRPVVTACTGHAYPMGAFLMLAADLRYGIDGPYRIGMNEVAIGITPPRFAVEIARQRLTAVAFNRIPVLGELISPTDAVAAGFLDSLVAESELRAVAGEAARRLAGLDPRSHAATKHSVRGQALQALRTAIDEELTLANAEAIVQMRDGG